MGNGDNNAISMDALNFQLGAVQLKTYSMLKVMMKNQARIIAKLENRDFTEVYNEMVNELLVNHQQAVEQLGDKASQTTFDFQESLRTGNPLS